METNKIKFKGFRQINGTSETFDPSTCEDGYVYFVRTDDNKQYGYLYLNGKKYGMTDILDAGEF